MAQRLVVDPVTRIEGHARIVLDLDASGQVERGRLHVLEIRGMEKLLQGSELFKMPQITGRICGVCPAAHHMASVTAIEQGLGITPPAAAQLLRALLYAGHVLHSHALSTFVLAGPDLLLGIGAPPEKRNIFALLGLDPELGKKALRLRSIGQRTVEIIGGRGVHPVTAIPGGMSFRPSADKLKVIQDWGNEALGLLGELVARVQDKLDTLEVLREAMTLPFPAVALSKGGEHTYLGGDLTVGDATGARLRSIRQADYATLLLERVVPSSYMKSVVFREPAGAPYFVGPLARLNLATTMPTPKANEALARFKSREGSRTSALDFVEARLVEMLGCAEALAALPQGIDDGPTSIEANPKAGQYVGIVESARGILVHDYMADEQGKVQKVNLIVATQNNYEAMDTAITGVARQLFPKQDQGLLLNGVEFALRCFDPCLSCATHAAGQMPLEVELYQGGALVGVISRRSQS
ncbi:MAG TPA: Ni/Fe hydrogenase subunit alpha [Thermoanaerobaculaceae bacterium]|nr:Ni/Fe hydrogenase subunit alpha [Thermoanaerobaculaceae bacterium]HRS16379.1 Ni/Fe hydrogenase subunit alpha [Thermoanaerobaculaceae bacterium]